MPPLVLALIPVIQGVIASAPQIETAVIGIKDFITSLVKSGAIPAELQNNLHAYVDDVVVKVGIGQPPPEFMVEPDPTNSSK